MSNESFTFYLHDEITKEMAASCISHIEFRKEDQIDIYLTSSRGDVYAAEVLIDYINNKSNKKITLIASGRLSHAAFLLFFYSKGEKRVLPHTFTELCFTSINVNTNSLPVESFDRFQMRNIEKRNDIFFEDLKNLGCFSEDELKKLKAGEELWFNSDRLNKIITQE